MHRRCERRRGQCTCGMLTPCSSASTTSITMTIDVTCVHRPQANPKSLWAEILEPYHMGTEPIALDRRGQDKELRV